MKVCRKGEIKKNTILPKFTYVDSNAACQRLGLLCSALQMSLTLLSWVLQIFNWVLGLSQLRQYTFFSWARPVLYEVVFFFCGFVVPGAPEGSTGRRF